MPADRRQWCDERRCVSQPDDDRDRDTARDGSVTRGRGTDGREAVVLRETTDDSRQLIRLGDRGRQSSVDIVRDDLSCAGLMVMIED